MPDELLDRDAVLDCLRTLGDLLAQRNTPHQSIILIGGSYLALLDLREATRDVDTVTHLDAATRLAISDVADLKGLSPKWLNDLAAGFRPAGLSSTNCSPILEHRALTVLAPSPDWVFLMKLYAARTVDYDDMVVLWPLCRFESAEDAVRRYWDAYPNAPEDQYLIDYVKEISERSQ